MDPSMLNQSQFLKQVRERAQIVSKSARQQPGDVAENISRFQEEGDDEMKDFLSVIRGTDMAEQEPAKSELDLDFASKHARGRQFDFSKEKFKVDLAQRRVQKRRRPQSWAWVASTDNAHVEIGQAIGPLESSINLTIQMEDTGEKSEELPKKARPQDRFSSPVFSHQLMSDLGNVLKKQKGPSPLTKTKPTTKPHRPISPDSPKLDARKLESTSISQVSNLQQGTKPRPGSPMLKLLAGRPASPGDISLVLVSEKEVFGGKESPLMKHHVPRNAFEQIDKPREGSPEKQVDCKTKIKETNDSSMSSLENKKSEPTHSANLSESPLKSPNSNLAARTPPKAPIPRPKPKPKVQQSSAMLLKNSARSTENQIAKEEEKIVVKPKPNWLEGLKKKKQSDEECSMSAAKEVSVETKSLADGYDSKDAHGLPSWMQKEVSQHRKRVETFSKQLGPVFNEAKNVGKSSEDAESEQPSWLQELSKRKQKKDVKINKEEVGMQFDYRSYSEQEQAKSLKKDIGDSDEEDGGSASVSQIKEKFGKKQGIAKDFAAVPETKVKMHDASSESVPRETVSEKVHTDLPILESLRKESGQLQVGVSNDDKVDTPSKATVIVDDIDVVMVDDLEQSNPEIEMIESGNIATDAKVETSVSKRVNTGIKDTECLKSDGMSAVDINVSLDVPLAQKYNTGEMGQEPMSKYTNKLLAEKDSVGEIGRQSISMDSGEQLLQKDTVGEIGHGEMYTDALSVDLVETHVKLDLDVQPDVITNDSMVSASEVKEEKSTLESQVTNMVVAENNEPEMHLLPSQPQEVESARREKEGQKIQRQISLELDGLDVKSCSGETLFSPTIPIISDKEKDTFTSEVRGKSVPKVPRVLPKARAKVLPNQEETNAARPMSPPVSGRGNLSSQEGEKRGPSPLSSKSGRKSPVLQRGNSPVLKDQELDTKNVLASPILTRKAPLSPELWQRSPSPLSQGSQTGKRSPLLQNREQDGNRRPAEPVLPRQSMSPRGSSSPDQSHRDLLFETESKVSKEQDIVMLTNPFALILSKDHQSSPRGSPTARRSPVNLETRGQKSIPRGQSPTLTDKDLVSQYSTSPSVFSKAPWSFHNENKTSDGLSSPNQEFVTQQMVAENENKTETFNKKDTLPEDKNKLDSGSHPVKGDIPKPLRGRVVRVDSFEQGALSKPTIRSRTEDESAIGLKGNSVSSNDSATVGEKESEKLGLASELLRVDHSSNASEEDKRDIDLDSNKEKLHKFGNVNGHVGKSTTVKNQENGMKSTKQGDDKRLTNKEERKPPPPKPKPKPKLAILLSEDKVMKDSMPKKTNDELTEKENLKNIEKSREKAALKKTFSLDLKEADSVFEGLTKMPDYQTGVEMREKAPAKPRSRRPISMIDNFTMPSQYESRERKFSASRISPTTRFSTELEKKEKSCWFRGAIDAKNAKEVDDFDDVPAWKKQLLARLKSTEKNTGRKTSQESSEGDDTTNEESSFKRRNFTSPDFMAKPLKSVPVKPTADSIVEELVTQGDTNGENETPKLVPAFMREFAAKKQAKGRKEHEFRDVLPKKVQNVISSKTVIDGNAPTSEKEKEITATGQDDGS